MGPESSRDTRYLRDEINDLEDQISQLQKEMKAKDTQLYQEKQAGDQVSCARKITTSLSLQFDYGNLENILTVSST